MPIQNCPNCNGSGEVPVGKREEVLPDGRSVVINNKEQCFVCRGERQIDVQEIRARGSGR